MVLSAREGPARQDARRRLFRINGEAFQERGFEGHARNVYREVTEVPLLISVPIPARARPRDRDADRERRRLADRCSTCSVCRRCPIDGRTQPPERAAGARVARDRGPGLLAPRSDLGTRRARPRADGGGGRGRYRFVQATLEGEREELFDRSHDGLEVENVLEEHPELGGRLRAAAERYLDPEDLSPWGSTPSNGRDRRHGAQSAPGAGLRTALTDGPATGRHPARKSANSC